MVVGALDLDLAIESNDAAHIGTETDGSILLTMSFTGDVTIGSDPRKSSSIFNKELKKHPVIMAVSMVLVAAILIFVGIIMFTGDISYTLTDDALLIEADYHADSTVPYERIDSLEFRDTAPEGTREWGFASARLMMGFFDNEEFGGHTRYSYTLCDAHIVAHCGGDILILSDRDEEATRALYEALEAKIMEVSQ